MIFLAYKLGDCNHSNYLVNFTTLESYNIDDFSSL